MLCWNCIFSFRKCRLHSHEFLAERILYPEIENGYYFILLFLEKRPVLNMPRVSFLIYFVSEKCYQVMVKRSCFVGLYVSLLHANPDWTHLLM